MNTAAIRQQLHSYLEVADDQNVRALYILMKHDIDQSGVKYTPEFKGELDGRYSDYKTSKTKMISSSESKKRVGKILKTGEVKRKIISKATNRYNSENVHPS
jgi:hypothetical protein